MNVFSRKTSLLVTFVLAITTSFVAMADDSLKKAETITPEEEAQLMGELSPIAVSEYQEPQSGGLGAWSVNHSGLSVDLWQNLQERQIINQLAQIPARIESRAIRELTLRTLMMETVRHDLSEAVLLARADALLRMGQGKLASELLKAVPDSLLSDAIMQSRHLLAVFANASHKRICKQVHEFQKNNPQAFWQRFHILCLFDAKEEAKAQLGLELLREQNLAPTLFTEITHSLANKKSKLPEIHFSDLSREELAWLIFAKKLPAPDKSASLEQLSLITLGDHASGEWEEAIEPFSPNLKDIRKPRRQSPDIALSLMRLKKEAKPSMVRRALLAFALRHLWEKPVSIETEEALSQRHYQKDMTELAPIWRVQASNLQDSDLKLSALLTLLRPFTRSLHHYTISDLVFLIDELKTLGLREDATIIAMEALAKSE